MCGKYYPRYVTFRFTHEAPDIPDCITVKLKELIMLFKIFKSSKQLLKRIILQISYISFQGLMKD